MNSKQKNQGFKLVISDSKALLKDLKTARSVLPDLAPETSPPILLGPSSNFIAFLVVSHKRQATPTPQSMRITRHILPLDVSIELVMLPNHLILYSPLPLLPSIFPSVRVFSKELALHIRWPKYWSFSNSPSNEYSGLVIYSISFKRTVQSLPIVT